MEEQELFVVDEETYSEQASGFWDNIKENSKTLICLDMDLLQLLKEKEIIKQQPERLEACAYYAHLLHWHSNYQSHNQSFVIRQKAVRASLGLNEYQDRERLKALQDAGYVIVNTEIVGKAGSFVPSTNRCLQWILSAGNPDSSGLHYWIPGIKDGLSVTDSVVLAEQMLHWRTRKDMSEHIGVSYNTVSNSVNKLIEKQYLSSDKLFVNFEKCGMNLTPVDHSIPERPEELVDTKKKRTLKNVGFTQMCREVIEHLNKCTENNFKLDNGVKTKLKKLTDRGYTKDDMFKVIEYKCNEWKWLETDKFNGHANLNPHTLFGDKFDTYLNTPVKYNAREEEKRHAEYNRRHATNYYQETGSTPYKHETETVTEEAGEFDFSKLTR